MNISIVGAFSLIKATENILNKLKVENKTFTKIKTPTRKEIKMFDYDAVKELVTNALVHNDWSNGYSPMRVFRDLNFVEQLGTGIQRVLKIYPKNIFEFFPNHIRVTINFKNNEFINQEEKNNYDRVKLYLSFLVSNNISKSFKSM